MLSTTRETIAPNRRIRVARLGSGEPLLLLHGYPENLQIWCRVAPQLAQRQQVIALDWPGLGYSDPWPGGATPRHLAERLLALLNHWGLDKVSILAMDMGAQPALYFAAHHPRRTASLIVMNSLVFADEATSWEIRWLRHFGWNRFFLQRCPGIVFRRAEKTFLTRGVRLSPELRRDFWDAFRRPAVRRFLSKMCAAYQGSLPQLPQCYPRIECPTFILWAERDRHFPPAHARRLQDAIAGSRLSVAPAAEHWMAWQNADLVSEQVAEFLRQTRHVT